MNLLEYDKKGFIPSRRAKSINEYMEESEKKIMLLEKFKDDPRVLSKRLGGELTVELYSPSQEFREKFTSYTLTEPWPAVLMREYTYHKFKPYKDLNFFSILFPVSILTRNTGKKEGSVLNYVSDNTNLSIPLLIYYSSDSERYLEGKYAHELAHSIRSQFMEPPRFFYGSEEIHAYNFEEFFGNYSPVSEWMKGRKKLSEENAFLLFGEAKNYGALGFGYGAMYALEIGFSTPQLALFPFSPIFSDLLLMTELAAIPFITGIYFHRLNKKIKKFFKKCVEEDIPPWYLLLRSNVTDYDLSNRKKIREQIEEKAKKNLRWKIIQMRLENEI